VPTGRVVVAPLASIEPAHAQPAEPAAIASIDRAPPKQPAPDVSETKPGFRPPLPLGPRYGTENANSRVILRLHRSIRVAVKGSGNHIFIDRKLGAGATYRVPNTPGVKLNAPDAGAVEVILDGNTVGFAGKNGVAAKGVGLDPPSIIRRYHWQ
jgi:cytoskeleton protein RodZ